MGQALRFTAEDQPLPVALQPENVREPSDPGASPARDLHDLLERRLAESTPAAAKLPSQLRMSIVFWMALAAWAVVALGVYAATALI